MVSLVLQLIKSTVSGDVYSGRLTEGEEEGMLDRGIGDANETNNGD